MNKAVQITIIETEDWTSSTPIGRYIVIVKVTPEFMQEPEHIVSHSEKAEYIAQEIKEEFLKKLQPSKPTTTY